MNNLEKIRNERTREEYFAIKHKSGLKIFIYPKEGFSSTYALFGTNFGSINLKFKPKDANLIEVPCGIAHFLEHKLFESEDGDAFTKYAKTGASANAYTSFGSTCYLFSCTQNFQESLRILLKFVCSPYFTKETIEKEQGIIGQEIKMYEDNPGWRVLFNNLKAMYHNHPIKYDIAGTVQTISKITPQNLYDCYNNFYNLDNMALCVAGKIEPEEVLKIADEILKEDKKILPEDVFPQEPETVVQEKIEEKLSVSIPLFQLGFKEKVTATFKTKEQVCATEILLEILSAKSSLLYRELLDKELINDSFGSEYFEGKGYAATFFSGESKFPEKVSGIIKTYIAKIQKSGIDKKSFEIAKKAVYGRNISILNSAENISNAILNGHFFNREIFEMLEVLANTELEAVNQRLNEQFKIENSSLSIIWPKD